MGHTIITDKEEINKIISNIISRREFLIPLSRVDVEHLKGDNEFSLALSYRVDNYNNTSVNKFIDIIKSLDIQPQKLIGCLFNFSERDSKQSKLIYADVLKFHDLMRSIGRAKVDTKNARDFNIPFVWSLTSDNTISKKGLHIDIMFIFENTEHQTSQSKENLYKRIKRIYDTVLQQTADEYVKDLDGSDDLI